MVNDLSCIEGKGEFEWIHCSAQNAVLFVDLLQNILNLSTQKLMISTLTMAPHIFIAPLTMTIVIALFHSWRR